MWINVTYDPKRQDQSTCSVDINDQRQVTAVTYQRINYLVCQSDTSDIPTIQSVYTATDGTNSVPIAGLTYTIEGQPGFICKQVYPKRTSESPFAIEVQCTFEAKFMVQPSDASQWNIKIALSGSKVVQPAYFGYNTDTSTAEAVTNSANQSYDPPPQKTWYDEQITVSYNTTSPPDFSTLRGCVNSATVSFTIQGVSRSFDANQLLLDEYSLSTTLTLTYATTPVWNVSCTLFGRSGTDSLGHANTFTRSLLDEGYCTFSGGKWALITDDPSTLNPVNSQQRLDGSGGLLPHSGTSVFRHYNIEDQADLNPVFAGLT